MTLGSMNGSVSADWLEFEPINGRGALAGKSSATAAAVCDACPSTACSNLSLDGCCVSTPASASTAYTCTYHSVRSSSISCFYFYRVINIDR